MAGYYVYRLFDANGALLYIGSTDNWYRRFTQHKKTSWWAYKVKSHTIEEFDSHEEMLKAERLAIGSEWPRYNVRHLGKAADWDGTVRYTTGGLPPTWNMSVDELKRTGNYRGQDRKGKLPFRSFGRR